MCILMSTVCQCLCPHPYPCQFPCLYACNCGQPAISLHSHHVSLVQWTTRLLPVTRPRVQIPWGVLMWNRNSPVCVVSLYWWPWRDWSLWPHLRCALSRTVTRPSCRQCDNPNWSHTAFLSRFHVAADLSSGFTTDGVSCWGGGGTLWKACNLTSFSPCLTGPVDYLFASCHKGPEFKSPEGYLCETGILLLALSRYSTT